MKKLLLILMVVVSGCTESFDTKNKKENPFSNKIDEFNRTSTYFRLDSVVIDSNIYNIYATDTLGFYVPTRHIQYYNWTCVNLFKNYTIDKKIQFIKFNVNMVGRKDGNIDVQIGKEELINALAPFTDQNFLLKITKLNELNHNIHITQFKRDHGDLIDNFNVYFAHQIPEGDHWSGNDSYFFIQGYIYNKTMMYDLTKHNKILDGILTDTTWFRNDQIRKQVYNLIKN